MSIKLNIVGDSNVDRHFATVKSTRDDPCIKDVTVTRATNLAQIKDVLLPAVVAEARTHVLLASLTNPVSMHPYTSPSHLIKHCDAVFTQIRGYIAESRIATPGDLEQVC